MSQGSPAGQLVVLQPGHPVHTFRAENAVVGEVLDELKAAAEALVAQFAAGYPVTPVYRGKRTVQRHLEEATDGLTANEREGGSASDDDAQDLGEADLALRQGHGPHLQQAQPRRRARGQGHGELQLHGLAEQFSQFSGQLPFPCW